MPGAVVGFPVLRAMLLPCALLNMLLLLRGPRLIVSLSLGMLLIALCLLLLLGMLLLLVLCLFRVLRQAGR